MKSLNEDLVQGNFTREFYFLIREWMNLKNYGNLGHLKK